MNHFDTIRHRRSIYPDLFSSEEVSKSDIIQILEAALHAPSHKKTYPWRFKVIQGAAKGSFGTYLANTYKVTTPEEKFSKHKYTKVKEKVSKSGAVIVICMHRDPKERVPEWEEIAATAMAVQNMWLQITQLGLGGYWSTPNYRTEVNSYLKLNQEERCLGFFYLGHYPHNAHPKARDIQIENYTSWIES